jgi:hypothetical protein
MHLRKQFTKQLNLNVCPETYDKIEKVASELGIKTGSMARQILKQWVKEQDRAVKQ